MKTYNPHRDLMIEIGTLLLGAVFFALMVFALANAASFLSADPNGYDREMLGENPTTDSRSYIEMVKALTNPAYY